MVNPARRALAGRLVRGHIRPDHRRNLLTPSGTRPRGSRPLSVEVLSHDGERLSDAIVTFGRDAAAHFISVDRPDRLLAQVFGRGDSRVALRLSNVDVPARLETGWEDGARRWWAELTRSTPNLDPADG